MGAAIAIAGSVILRVLCGTNSRPDTLQAPIIVAFLIACVVAMLFGAFNGVLVAYFKIQRRPGPGMVDRHHHCSYAVSVLSRTECGYRKKKENAAEQITK